MTKTKTTAWICKRCETVNEDSTQFCVVCDSPMLYTHDELEQVVTRRLQEVKTGMEAEAAKTGPVVASAPPVASANCDGPWILATVFGISTIGLLVFLVLLFLSG